MWLCFWLCRVHTVYMETNTTKKAHGQAERTALLAEAKQRVAAGEDHATVLRDLQSRPEWELVAQAQGLR
jgi:hypothetical protein